MPLTDAWCKGWHLPSLSELWGMAVAVTPRGMPEPHPILLATQSVGNVLDGCSIDATPAAAVSVGGAGLGAGQPRMGTSGTGLGSGLGVQGWVLGLRAAL